MLLDSVWELLQAELFTVSSTPLLFNQYRDYDPALERPSGPAVRRQNLLKYLRSFRRRPRVLVVGEAIGYRGGRFSGIPLISERQLATSGLLPFKGHQTSLGPRYSEQSATLLRKVLPPQPAVLTWNAVPLHPHRAESPLSNRTPSAKEVALYAGLLRELYSIVRPRLVVALGRKAAGSLERLEIPHSYVRHPANGGGSAFVAGMQAVFSEVADHTRRT